MYTCEFCGKEYLNFDAKESCYRKCLKAWMENLVQSFGPIPHTQQVEAAYREERRKEQELNIAGNLTNIWACLHKEPLAKEAIHEAFMWFWSRFWPSETVSVSEPPYRDDADKVVAYLIEEPYDSGDDRERELGRQEEGLDKPLRS